MITCLFILYGGFIMTGNSCKGRSDNQFIHLRREMDKSGYKCCSNLWGCNGYRTKERHWPDVLQSDLCKKSEIPAQVRTCCVAFSFLITEVMASYCRCLQSTSVMISFRDGPNDYFHGWLLAFRAPVHGVQSQWAFWARGYPVACWFYLLMCKALMSAVKWWKKGVGGLESKPGSSSI